MLGGATFIMGALAGGAGAAAEVPGAIIPAVFAFLFHFGREIIKDIADIEGDRAAGLKTTPLIVSSEAALMVTTIIYVILIISTVLPIWLEWYGLIYGIIVLMLVDIPLLLILFLLWKSSRPVRFSAAGRYLKFVMLPGLAAFLLGKI